MDRGMLGLRMRASASAHLREESVLVTPRDRRLDLHDPFSPCVSWFLQLLADKVKQEDQLCPESTSLVSLQDLSTVTPSLSLTFVSIDSPLVCRRGDAKKHRRAQDAVVC
jgi:hypothetical protein